MSVWLDISAYQDARPIDFSRLKAAGVEGVIIKASEGTTGVNGFFVRDAAAAAQAGLKVGAYAFTRPDVVAPEAEADHFASIASQTPRLDTWADDAETGGHAGAASWGDWHGRFCARVDTHLGSRVAPAASLFYSAGWCMQFGWGFDGRVTQRGLWVAKYGGGAPGPLPGWSKVTLWQDRSNAVYPGIVGAVDEDIALVPFPPFTAQSGVQIVGSPHLTDVVTCVVTPNGDGAYTVEANGGLWPEGNAPTFTAAGSGPNGPRNLVGHMAAGRHVVDFALHHDANGAVDGYWFLQDDGGIFPFGAAPGWGSPGGKFTDAVALVVHPAMTGYVVKQHNGGAWPYGPQPPAFASEA